jgi:histidinol-phosphate aminotransferase
MTPAIPRPHPDIMRIKPYVAGLPSIPGMRAKLNSNESAFGVPPASQRAIAESSTHAHRYPDSNDTALRQGIGEYYGLDPERIVCGAGADRLITCLVTAYGGPGTETIISQPTYYEYERTSIIVGGTVVKVPARGLNQSPPDFTADVDGMLRAVTDRTRIVFLANPDNPTGSFLPKSEVRRLRAGLPSHVVLALDAAYNDFATHPDYSDGLDLVEECLGKGDNTVVLYTFSKMWGLAGERIGWCYAAPSMVDVLNRVRDPFNIASSSTAAALAALQEPDWESKMLMHNTEQRLFLTNRLKHIGLDVLPSETNFILVGFGTAARAAAADAYLRERGVLVRNMRMYELPQMLRITIGSTEEVALVAYELDAFVEANS